VKDAPGRSYGDVGERVASVFESAEKAATEINEVAEREAEQLAVAKMADADAHHDRVRASDVESRVTAETERARAEVDEYVSHQTAAADRMRSEVEERTVMIEKKAHQDLADAHASASAIRKQADADAKRIIADAKDAGDRIVDDARDDAEQAVNDAQREAVEIVVATERKAAVRTDTVLRNAQQRLEIMVSAEREVFGRMARAFDALRGAPDLDGLSPQAALPETTSNGGFTQNYLDR